MLEHHGKRWGDKVRIVGISIDQSPDAVVKHVKAKKWEKVEHFHRGASTADNDYGVKGVPHVVLIDTNGKIAFIGHPAERDLEKDIETLLKGEKLKGVKGAATEEGEESTWKELDQNVIDRELEQFRTMSTELTTDQNIKKNAALLQRAMVVMMK